MRKFWQKIDENINRTVYLVGFLGLVSGAMSWAAAYITPLYQYGWGAVVFAGVGAACGIVLVISSAFVAWRYFKPLAKQLAPTEDKAPSGIDFVKNISITNSPNAPALFRGTASTTLERVTIFLDYSAYFTNVVNAGWYQPIRIKLAAFAPFEKEICYKATVVSRTDTDELKWGDHLGYNDLIGRGKYRARLVFIAQGKEQYFDFMLLVPTCREVILLNKNDFSFQWDHAGVRI